MVDAIDLALLKVAADTPLQIGGAGQVMAEGLFDHDPPPAALLAQQAHLPQLADHAPILIGSDGHVEGDVARALFVQPLAQPLVEPGVLQVTAKVFDAPRKALEQGLVETTPRLGGNGIPHLGQPLLGGEGPPAGADDAHARPQATRLVEVVEGGEQLGRRQVAGGPEDHVGTGVIH